MNTQQYLGELFLMSVDQLRDKVAKLTAEEQQLDGSARKLAEYKLHLAREELSRR